MVKFEYKYGLPFCEVIIEYQGNSIILDNVLLDTGSGGTIFKMDYGFDINGIIGIDFLKHMGAIIDLDKMLVYTRDNYKY